MSDALTDTFENRVLNWLLTSSSVTRPSAWYVGLFTSGNGPSDSASGTEISGNGYTRKVIAFTVTNNVGSNNAVITFPTATGNWGTVAVAGIFDASSGGNLIAYANLTNTKDIQTSDILQIASGDLTITLT